MLLRPGFICLEVCPLSFRGEGGDKNNERREGGEGREEEEKGGTKKETKGRETEVALLCLF